MAHDTTWSHTPVQFLREGDVIRTEGDTTTARVGSIGLSEGPDGGTWEIVLEDPHSGEPVAEVHGRAQDRYLRAEPVELTVSGDAVAAIRLVDPDEEAFKRLQAGPMTLSLPEAEEAIAALERCLETPGPGASARVHDVDNDEQRSWAAGSLSTLWMQLGEAADNAEIPELAAQDGLELGW